MATTDAAWIRRLFRDNQPSSAANEPDESLPAEEGEQHGKRFSLTNSSGSSVHPRHQNNSNKHKHPPNIGRSRAFLAGLVQSSKRRLSLPVNIIISNTYLMLRIKTTKHVG